MEKPSEAVGFFCYVAQGSHKEEEGIASMKVGDTIVVAATALYERNLPPEAPTGFLYGQNSRTGQSGYFQGDDTITAIVSLLNFNISWMRLIRYKYLPPNSPVQVYNIFLQWE